MTTRVFWSPNTEPDIASYDLQRTADLAAPSWTLIGNIPHNLAGPNYDTELEQFFFDDVSGDGTQFYRLIAIDTADNSSAAGPPFQTTSPEAAIDNVVKVDHNFGSAGGLRYQTTSGLPIEDAVVRVFKKTDFDQGLTDTALATTRTNALGNWLNPVFLTTGFTYTIQFAKEGLYGPDKREIVV